MSVNGVDVTHLFKQTCQALCPEKSAKVASLTMLDAMNALQTMDSKMDTGAEAYTTHPTFVPSRVLSAPEVCWVIDEMVAREAAWLRGATLCQSVYASLYYHNVNLVPDDTAAMFGLRAHILGYIKSVDLVYTELSKGHVSDGEDCWLDHYGLPVQMSDTVEGILSYLDEAIAVLLADEEQGLADRLRIRRDMITALVSLNSLNVDATNDTIRNIALSTSRVDGVFDDKIASRLRQHMPLPESPTIIHGYGTLARFFGDLEVLSLQDEESLWATGWRTDLLAITRSLLKSILFTPGSSTPLAESVANEWICQATALPAQVLAHLAVISSNPGRFTIWKGLVEGYTISTLSCPLLNRSRQRRTLQSLSFAWLERATMAEQSDHPDFHRVAAAMHGKRLDCLLEAALAAFDLELISPEEERLAWWWIHQICVHRSALALQPTIRASWARMWASIATAMQLRLTATPMSQTCLSRAGFELRFKWARKFPAWDGRRALRPTFGQWTAVQDQLDSVMPSEDDILGHLKSARNDAHRLKMRTFADENFLVVLNDLLIDLDLHMRCTSRRTTFQWAKRRRWLPLPLATED